MKYYIEEAIIVEVHEKEPHFRVETVIPEVIQTQKKRKRNKDFLEGIFDLFLDPFSFLDDLMDEPDYIEEEPQLKKEIKKIKPEIALITDTDENRIKEYRYFYYEINE